MLGRLIRGALLLSLTAGLALALGACGGSSTIPTLPTTTPTYTTDTFSSTLVQLGAVVHPFTVATSGAVSITLTSVAPLATMALGVGIGTWDGTSCSTITVNDNSKMNVAALSGTAAAGSYCIRVYDSGNIPDGGTVNYTVQVVHP